MSRGLLSKNRSSSFATPMPKQGGSGTELVEGGDGAPRAGADKRLVDVWCAFMDRLATDAEAAHAVAMAYRELDGPSRDVWISTLEQDIDQISVPRIAVYAPLLAVETDAKRRARVTQAMGTVPAHVTPRTTAYALCASPSGPYRLTLLVTPLYLDFVQVLACSHKQSGEFEWVKHDPIVDRSRAPRAGDVLYGNRLEAVPLKAAVDDLAHSVVAQTRSGLPVPEALRAFADLFSPVSDVPSEPTHRL